MLSADDIAKVLGAVAAVIAALGGWGIFAARREARGKAPPPRETSAADVLLEVRAMRAEETDRHRETEHAHRDARDRLVRIEAKQDARG